MKRSLWIFVVLIFFSLSTADRGTAQERMRIAWAGSTPSNTPIWVADQKGFFKKNGLNAEVIAMREHDCHTSIAHRRGGFHHRSVCHVGDIAPRRRRHSDGLDQLAAVHRSHCFSRRYYLCRTA